VRSKREYDRATCPPRRQDVAIIFAHVAAAIERSDRAGRSRTRHLMPSYVGPTIFGPVVRRSRGVGRPDLDPIRFSHGPPNAISGSPRRI